MSDHCANGRTGRCLTLRLGSAVDLMEGLRAAAEEAGIRSAYIPVVIGGVSRAIVEVARPSTSSPVGVEAKRIELDGPLAILGAQGMICELDDGGLEPHLHITFTDSNGRVLGGHLVAGTAPVTTTADVVLQEVLGVKYGRRRDPGIGATLLFPEETSGES